MSKTKYILGLWLIVLLCWATSTIGSLGLGLGGEPLAEIVLPSSSHSAVQFAAEELQHWVEAITGARLPIVTEPGTELVSITLAVNPEGYENDLAQLADSDGYAVRGHPDGIILFAGRPRGVLYGAYRLLYRNSDIIWARPHSAYGTIYSPNPSLTLQEVDYIDIPAMSLRGWQMSGPEDDIVKWQLRNGSNWWMSTIKNADALRTHYDSIREYGGGHNLVSRYITEAKYFDTHPEYFPLKGGKRLRPSETKGSTQLCFTAPGLQETFIQELDGHVDANPNYDTYRIMIEDNYNLCECESCLASIILDDGRVIDKDDESFRSTQFFLWLNPIALHLKEKYGKDVLSFGYFFTEPPPHCPIEPNIRVSYCPINKNSKYTLTNSYNQEIFDRFSGWAEVTDQIVWREYYGLYYAFPRPIDVIAMEDWRYMGEFGVDQTYSEMRPDSIGKPAAYRSWHINSLYFWVLANGAWNPDQDVTGLRNDFLNRVYGPAAQDVGEFYNLIEDQWFDIHGTSKYNDNAYVGWNKHVFETGITNECRAALDRAATKTLGANSRRMLDELRGVFDYYLGLLEESKVHAFETTTPPEFDPTFTTGAWRRATPSSTFLMNTDGEPYPQPTSVRALYDEDNIYFGFRCEHDDPSKMLVEAYNGGLNKFPEGECFEIFLEGEWQGKRHFTQMVINPNNNRYNAVRQVNWQSQAQVHAQGWSGMVTVSWQSLGLQPQDTGSLKIACFRQFMKASSPGAAPTQNAALPGGDKRHSNENSSKLVLEPIVPVTGEHAEWLPGWGFRRMLEIDAGQIDQNLTNFPLLVRIDSGIIDFNVGRPDGHDIRFTADDGLTLLDYERERHDPDQAKAVYWVRIPLLRSSFNTSLFVYYGNQQATDDSNPTSVWDENHMAVWHLAGENEGTQRDSTANAYDLTVYGDVAEGEDGMMADSIALAGSTENPQYLASLKGSTYPTFDTTEGITYSAWARPTTASEGTIIAVGGVNWNPYWLTYMGYYNDGSAHLRANSHGGTADSGPHHTAWGQTARTFATDQWSHVAISVYYDELVDESTLSLYINGEIVKSHTATNQTLRNPFENRPLVVGARTHSSWNVEAPRLYFNGWIDEARVSNTRRSDAWIAASYHNQKPDSTLISTGVSQSSELWYAGWRYRRQIRIKGDDVTEDLHDFPLVVRLPPRTFDFGMTKPDGSDIRFAAGDGATPLNFEREAHDIDQNLGIYWVKIPLLPAVVGTNIYIYYGKANAGDASSSQTWDGDHVAVWHLGAHNGANQPDSTVNGNDLNLYGEVEGQEAIIGGGIGLAGDIDGPAYLATPAGRFPSIDTTKGITLSAWGYPTNQPPINAAWCPILAIGGNSWSRYWYYVLGNHTSSRLQGAASGYSGDGYAGFDSLGRRPTGFPLGSWTHVAMTLYYDDVADGSTMRLYANGVQLLDETIDGNVLRNPLSGRPLVVGTVTHSPWPSTDPKHFFNGFVDEVRFSKTRRSPAWLAASYHNQKPASDMLIFGPREPPVGSIILLR